MAKMKEFKKIDNITIEDADIGFKNFAGKEGKFNAKGKRNFAVFIDEETASILAGDGWNVKVLEPREDTEDQPRSFLKVSVSYEGVKPRIFKIVEGRKPLLLDSETVEILDYSEISYVDLIIRPYIWEVSGKTGVAAYVKDMYVTINENEFERKYFPVQDNLIDEFPDTIMDLQEKDR